MFLNVPFDKEYEPLFLALIASLVGLGLTPRSVLEIPTTRDRLRRIWSLIRQCRFSIHDLSRVQLSKSGHGVPRFNMPFEAGLAIAFGLGAPHEWRVFEEKPYRLQQSLSDLNGFEPFIHRGTPGGVLEAVMDAFVDLHADENAIKLLLQLLTQYRKEALGPRLFEPRAFRKLVRGAVGIREEIRAES